MFTVEEITLLNSYIKNNKEETLKEILSNYSTRKQGHYKLN